MQIVFGKLLLFWFLSSHRKSVFVCFKICSKGSDCHEEFCVGDYITRWHSVKEPFAWHFSQKNWKLLVLLLNKDLHYICVIAPGSALLTTPFKTKKLWPTTFESFRVISTLIRTPSFKADVYDSRRRRKRRRCYWRCSAARVLLLFMSSSQLISQLVYSDG